MHFSKFNLMKRMFEFARLLSFTKFRFGGFTVYGTRIQMEADFGMSETDTN